MDRHNVPIATVACLVGVFLIGWLGDFLILILAPPPISANHRVWWSLIPIPVIHHLGQSMLSEYCKVAHLPGWNSIHSWAIRYPGLWGWITTATWWWVIAIAASFGATLWLVWRRPNKPDEHLRGTGLADEVKAYHRLVRRLKREE